MHLQKTSIRRAAISRTACSRWLLLSETVHTLLVGIERPQVVGSLLLLNAEQKKAAESLFTKYCTAPEWVGYSSIKLGDAGSEILRNEKRLQIVETQTVDLGVVHLSEMPKTKEELTAFEPPLEPPLDSLAKECRFEWMAAPPIVPDSASPDVLHQAWNVVKVATTERLDALDELNQPSKIPGFGRKAKELQRVNQHCTRNIGYCF